jgi:hypothetical protein
LPKRFKLVPDSVWQQIETMSFERREQLLEDLVTADSLEQLGLGLNSSTGASSSERVQLS